VRIFADYTVIANYLTWFVAVAAGYFMKIMAFQPAHFADFGKRETSFGNLGRCHWTQAAFVVS
jgi:hypothetical protein